MTWVEFVTTAGQRVSVNETHIIKVAKGPGETTYVQTSWVYGEPSEIHVQEEYEHVMLRLSEQADEERESSI